MKIVKQSRRLSILNIDGFVSKTVDMRNKRHGSLLPNTIRCLVCGPSNCGKTNVVLNLLFSPDGLCFENVYLFSKSLYQSKYKFLECVLKNMEEIGYFAYSDNDEVPFPSDIKPNSVMIFDDVACGKQENIKNYFSMGRHNEIDTFYICQTYSVIPKQLVRDNSNLLIVFKQDDRNLHHIYKDHVNTDMKFEKFKELCHMVWNRGKNCFLTIDKDRDINKGRYRIGFDMFIKDI